MVTPGNRSDVMPLNKGTSGLRNFGRLTSIIDLAMMMITYTINKMGVK